MRTRVADPVATVMTVPHSDESWVALLDEIVEKRPTGSTRKQDRSKRREAEIIRAAIRVFAREGISRTRSGDIAAEAGMPVSTIYEYYAGKADISSAAPLVHLHRFYEEYRQSVAIKTTAYDRLWHYLWLCADFARRNPEWARVFYLEIWPSVNVPDSPVLPGLNDYVRVIIHLLRQGAARGEWPDQGDYYETAALLTGAINQIIVTWALFRQPKDLSKAAASMASRVLSLLQPGNSR
jgi:AcrR family transcriptional regulator